MEKEKNIFHLPHTKPRLSSLQPVAVLTELSRFVEERTEDILEPTITNDSLHKIKNPNFLK
jgi:hypothetical protein